jgi:hypothetical protein
MKMADEKTLRNLAKSWQMYEPTLYNTSAKLGNVDSLIEMAQKSYQEGMKAGLNNAADNLIGILEKSE